MRVEANSPHEVFLFIAEYTVDDRISRVVGTASPSIIPAMTATDVWVAAPPGDAWALFVNPAVPGNAGSEPILSAADFANHSFEIVIGVDGRVGFGPLPD